LVERVDALAGKVPADEFELFLVELRGLHHDRKLTVDQRRDFDVDEL
jgi:hypothetical protein